MNDANILIKIVGSEIGLKSFWMDLGEWDLETGTTKWSGDYGDRWLFIRFNKLWIKSASDWI